MLKFAFALAVAFEWLTGPSVYTVHTFEVVAFHTFCATLLAWIVLETWRTLYLGAMSLDHADAPRSPAPGAKG
jgi:hypothetical protein